ncbi:hypothetical protein J4Q44_G00060990 [Coregonus suidteri]|uniref:Uncharacterized protein n=1 Tax=Coregonus suidteri TaxID=861788 RepID=A0AAN8M2X6_9TELE
MVPGGQNSLLLQPLLSDTEFKVTVTPVYADGDGTGVSRMGRTYVLEISPSQNNGSHGSMNHLLRTPWHTPIYPVEQTTPGQCPLVILDPIDTLGCTLFINL